MRRKSTCRAATCILAALALALTAALASPAVAAGRHRATARAVCTPIVIEGIPGRFCAGPARGR